MNEQVNAGRIDMGRHLENRAKSFPPEALVPYAGQEVAFSADGTQIVAHGEDFLTLWNQLINAGIDPGECVWASIPSLEEETIL